MFLKKRKDKKNIVDKKELKNKFKGHKNFVKLDLDDIELTEKQQNEFNTFLDNREEPFLTIPYFDYKETEIIIKEIKSIVFKDEHNSTDNIKIPMTMYEFDKNKLQDLEDHDINVSYDYENVLISIFEYVVHVSDDFKMTFDEITKLLSEIRSQYIEDTNVEPESIPLLPTEKQFDLKEKYKAVTLIKKDNHDNNIEKDVPHDRDTFEEKKEAPQPKESFEDNKNDNKTEQPGVNDESDFTPKTEFQPGEKIKSTGIEKKNNNTVSVGMNNPTEFFYNLSDRKMDYKEIMKSCSINPILFPINNGLKRSEPYETDYVDYKVSQLRLEQNQKLINLNEQVNTRSKLKLGALVEQVKTNIQDSISNIIPELKVDKASLKKEVEGRYSAKSENDTTEITRRLNSECKSILDEIQRKADIEKEQTQRSYNQKISEEITKLNQKYEEKIDIETQEEYEKAKKEVQEHLIITFGKELDITKEQINNYVNKLRIEQLKILRRKFNEYDKYVNEERTKYKEEYYNAIQAHAIEERVKGLSLEEQKKQEQDIINKVNKGKEIDFKNVTVAIDNLSKTLNAEGRNEKKEPLSERPPYKVINNIGYDNKHSDNQDSEQTKDISTAIQKETTANTQEKPHTLNTWLITIILIILIVTSTTTIILTTRSNNDSETSTVNKKLDEVNDNLKRIANFKQSGEVSNNRQDKTSSLKKIDANTPDEQKKMVQNGQYELAINEFPENIDYTETTAFYDNRLKTLAEINKNHKTTYGLLDEAILKNNNDEIIKQYEVNGLSYKNLYSKKRTTAVGNAYLNRNYLYNGTNDFLNSNRVLEHNLDDGNNLRTNILQFTQGKRTTNR